MIKKSIFQILWSFNSISGENCIGNALKKCHIAIIDLILSKIGKSLFEVEWADLDQILCQLIEDRNVKMIKYLLEYQGFKMNQKINYLNQAIFGRNIEIIELLLRHPGTNINAISFIYFFLSF